VQWLTPAILATQEVDIGRNTAAGQLNIGRKFLKHNLNQ
jgi:hypothetical protein